MASEIQNLVITLNQPALALIGKTGNRTMKPNMFIGSSVEGLPIAEAIQSNLFHQIDADLWSQGIFDLSNNTLDELISKSKIFDFATFIMTPDDIAEIRNKEYKVSRDNVLFELGLFIGAMGKWRVFFVTPNTVDFHLPTDLLGVTPASYNPDSHSGNLEASLGPACTKIKKAVENMLKPNEGLANLSGDWEGYWAVEDSNNFEKKNFFTASIKQVGATITSSFTTDGVNYPVKGEIHRGGYLTGIWGNPENGATYFGPFQLIISPSGKKLTGVWSGFKENNSIDSGEFVWERK